MSPKKPPTVNIIERELSGIPGFDTMVEGGIPRGDIVLLYGGPGTGKTIFALQFLFNGAAQNKNGVFFTLDEPTEKIRRHCSRFTFFKPEFDGTSVRLTDKEVLYAVLKKLDIQRMEDAVEKIADLIEAMNVSRVVIDPINCFEMFFPETFQFRKFSSILTQRLSAMGVTCMLVLEERDYLAPERYSVDGVIHFRTMPFKERKVRVIEVEKMRGTDQDLSLTPYDITKNGIMVHPGLSFFSE
jgi:KaiC/GvpD/RAD55 family RecA-like ATPase